MEGLWNQLQEALVNGVPVISSRDGGAIELIEDEANGWLFGRDIREFINIYGDPQAKAIDESGYAEFSSKLSNFIKLFSNNAEKYWFIAFRGYVGTPPKVDIRSVLEKYYLLHKGL